MSTMKATGGHSEACCNIPPIVSSGYQKKGDFETFDGRKTYVTGPAKEATKAIFIVMDIFGFFDQTVQGCDILASADDHNKYAVFMPDAFDGAPLDISLFPPDNDEKQQKVGAFFGKNSPPSFVPKAHATVKAIQDKYPNIKEWGVLGFCWGSKVISLSFSSGESPFKIAAEIHPAMVDPKDAENIKVPLIMLASKDEDAGDVKKFEAALTGPKHVEIFDDQIHGWMAARSDLTDKRVQEEYTRGYKTVLNFFAKHFQ
ncbi:putative dienelactone hydrolase family protein [Diaporthe ampelina]|uniref:Putative dienelactone hydrolase family protein n=1 Tax=Diaporthe ampelina TaxID=1214573 RepID=A0A0G2HRY6_9PEZI|nr:putative dienelactone hydrolase family protein [Diaporthe ampelina]